MPTQAGAQTAGHDPGAKIFHWVTVALIGAQFIIGLIMPSMRHLTPPGGLASLHFSWGA